MRRWIRTSFVVVLFISTFLIPSSTFATDYNNQDPQLNGCSRDAITPLGNSSFWITEYAYVEIRWSEACQANWARITVTDGTLRNMSVWLEDVYGVEYGRQTYKKRLEGWSFTKVDLHDGNLVKACGRVGNKPKKCILGLY